MDIGNLLSENADDNLLKLSRSDQLVHDWQAIRIVREGYIGSWKLLLTYFTWFSITILGAGAFALKADLKPSYISAFGAMGDVAILIQILMLLAFKTTIKKTKRSLDKIIDIGGVIDKRYVSSNLIVGNKFAARMIYFLISGMVFALLFWNFLFFYALNRL